MTERKTSIYNRLMKSGADVEDKPDYEKLFELTLKDLAANVDGCPAILYADEQNEPFKECPLCEGPKDEVANMRCWRRYYAKKAAPESEATA